MFRAWTRASILCSLPLWVAAQQGASEAPLSRHFHQLLWGNPKAFPGQQRHLISTAFPRFALGSPSRWTCQKRLPREASGSYPDQMPSRLHWLLAMQRSTSSNLSSSFRSKLLSFLSLPQGYDHRIISLCSFTHQIEKCIFVLCKQTPETVFPAAQMWVQRVETHQHSGQFPMLSYPAMCTGATVQSRAGEDLHFIT